MEITNVRIFKANHKGPVLAYANITLEDYFIIRGIKLIETKKSGRFLAMPSRRIEPNKRIYRDLCHPLNADVREDITKTVFSVYDDFIASEQEQEQAQAQDKEE